MDEKLCRICLCLEDEATKHVLIFETKESSEIAQKIFLISGVQVCFKIFLIPCIHIYIETNNYDK